MFHRSSLLASALFGCALMGCTPPAEPEAEGRDVWWDAPGMDTHFHSEGVEIQPDAGPMWRWELAGIHAAGSDAWLPGTPEVPASDDATQSFGRGGVIEHYVRRGTQIEQQFLIPEPLPLDGRDLVIEGMIDSDGTFADHGDHWSWADDRGALTLGDVTVLDATDRELRATMQVSYDGTRIVIDASDLANAAYPVVVDPVVGPDQFLVSTPSASGRVNAVAVAYNPNANELFVVWSREVSGHFEVQGRRVAPDGSLLGSPVTISTHAAGLDAGQPAVSFDPEQDRYLVVWSGERIAGEYEIFGRRLDANAVAIDVAGVRISTQGTDGQTQFDAVDPRVAYNPVSNGWFVVYEADEGVNGDQYVWSYLVSTGGVVGSRQKISSGVNAVDPDVAVDPAGNALVVWRGETTGPREIHGRLLSSAGVPQGAAEIELTAQDTGGGNASTAEKPRVVFNPAEDEYLVVFHGTDASLPGGLGAQVYATQVNANLSATSTTRLSAQTGSTRPDVAYNDDTNSYLVSFQLGALGQRELYATEVEAAALTEIAADQPLSSMGGLSPGYDGQHPAVVFASATASRSFLTVWEGDDDSTGDENEQAFGRLYAPSNLAPVANANGPYNPASFTVDFSSAGSLDVDGSLVGYDWDFGDGSPHSLASNPQHTYAPGGPYTVTLTVTDDDGADNTDTAVVTLQGLPIAQPVIPATGSEGTPVAFTGNYIGAPTAHSFLWDFGDGTTSTQQNPSHVYADGNTYTVMFTVVETGAGSDVASGPIAIANVGPTANATFPSGGNEGDALAFSAAPSDPGNDLPYTYDWDFGDGSSSSQASPAHVYADDGSYSATLVVTDNELLESTLETATVVVDNVDPIAEAGGPYSGGAGPISLSGSVTDPGAEVFTYSWDFGDGSSGSNQQNPTHSYAEGVYTATFTVDDGDGGIGIDTATVTVGPPTSVSETVDALIVYANTSYSAEFGGPDVIFAGAGGRLEPANIQNQFQAIVDALAQGCTSTNQVQNYAGGSFRRPVGYGFHSIGDATVSNAVVLGNPPRIGGVFDGTALTFGHPGDASKFNNYGQLFADRSDGGFLAGRWVRTAGKKGVWMAIHGTCDDTGATARQALEPWFRSTLP